MKNAIKTFLIGGAILAFTGFAQAQTVETTTTDLQVDNLGPGYAETIDMASVPALDETIAMYDQFEQPTNFMSDAGVYRYAYYEKTGIWLTRQQAEQAVAGMNNK